MRVRRVLQVRLDAVEQLTEQLLRQSESDSKFRVVQLPQRVHSAPKHSWPTWHKINHKIKRKLPEIITHFAINNLVNVKQGRHFCCSDLNPQFTPRLTAAQDNPRFTP